MAFRIELSAGAERDLKRLQEQDRARILHFLRDRLLPSENPRLLGQALKGSRFGDLWRYRVGDFRVIARIQDELMLIVVVRVGHRREIYR